MRFTVWMDKGEARNLETMAKSKKPRSDEDEERRFHFFRTKGHKDYWGDGWPPVKVTIEMPD
jgi:hypothetical protein